MSFLPRVLLFSALSLTTPFFLHADVESKIAGQMQKLHSLPDAQRRQATVQLASDIRALPLSVNKVKLADELGHLVTEGDQGQDTVQAVADTLRQSLAETPIPAKKAEVPMPYMDLASLARYEGAAEELNDPLYAKADFTLKDLHGKKWTLSELRGKIVMVNFWATWCGPYRLEMPYLDYFYTRFQPQGLVVLSLTNEDAFKVASFFAANAQYHPPVLLDQGGKVSQQFHIQGIPRTFLFDRDGKLIAEAIDQRSQQQFLAMLSKTDLHP
jgi:thiol-disulfide isomerase/thioredoxin